MSGQPLPTGIPARPLALTALLAVLTAFAPRGAAAGPDSPSVDSRGCPLLQGHRIEAALALEGASGPDWAPLSVAISCKDEIVDVRITRSDQAAVIDEALFFDPNEIADRERWLAGAIADLASETFNLARTPKTRVSAAPAPSPITRAEAPTFVEPAPTFAELLGPAFIGVRASFRWLRLDEDAQTATLGAQIGHQTWASLAPYLAVAYSTADSEPRGADLNIRILHLGGGVIWRRPVAKHWWFENELGLSALKGSLTRQLPMGIDNRQRLRGWSAGIELNPMLVRDISGTRLAFGPSLGWIFDLPVSELEGTETVSLNGPWLGFMLHVGSFGTR